MNLLLAALLAAQAASSAPERVANQMLTVEGVGTITYGIAVPSGSRDTPRPLILALHPGGGGVPYYGSSFMRQIVLPALGDLQAVIVAPDCPARSLVPTYVIHSRKDQVVPFAPAQQNAQRLRDLGRPIRFEELDQPSQYEMGACIEPLRRAGGWIAEQWRK